MRVHRVAARLSACVPWSFAGSVWLRAQGVAYIISDLSSFLQAHIVCRCAHRAAVRACVALCTSCGCALILGLRAYRAIVRTTCGVRIATRQGMATRRAHGNALGVWQRGGRMATREAGSKGACRRSCGRARGGWRVAIAFT